MNEQDWRDVDRDDLLRNAEAGQTSAMHDLGVIAYYERDATTAQRWFHEAASIGYTQSMYNLGVVLSGLGRRLEAEPWFIAAAAAGDSEAMFNLVLLNTFEDRADRAAYWRRKAQEAGHDLAASTTGVPPDVREAFYRDGLPRETRPA